MSNDLLYYGIILFIFFIILGLYLSQESPLNINQKNQILMENFVSESSTTSQKKGASQLYKWGLPENNSYEAPKSESCTKKDDIPPFTPKPIEPPCDQEEITCNKKNNQNCQNSDILSNKDIDKYVLKSSIPPCPDVSKYATKNMIQSCPDISKYILKSEIPNCERFDKSKYILKSEIPACPKCPICPICPVCPVCPKQEKCKLINQYKIDEHPDLNNYINKKDIDKYIKENGLCKKPENESKNIFNGEESGFDEENDDGSGGNNGGNNGENKDKCTYPNMLDRVFAQGSNLKTNNMVGMYAGDNLYAKFNNNDKKSCQTNNKQKGLYVGDNVFA